jgi:hypothetical protein
MVEKNRRANRRIAVIWDSELLRLGRLRVALGVAGSHTPLETVHASFLLLVLLSRGRLH